MLFSRQFLPLFATQFLGAFNDNLFKSILVALIVFRLPNMSEGLALSGPVLVNIAALLFILPFFLFSGLAGQLSDRVGKSRIIMMLKRLEMLIMVIGATLLIYQQVYGLMVVLFLMGTQSAFFGPAKYAILPELLDRKHLMSGNGAVEAGTFVAILIGSLLGAWLVDEPLQATGAILIGVSLMGVLVSNLIPRTPGGNVDSRPDYNLLTSTRSLYQAARQAPRSVYMSILGISWFWFLGASILTQMPAFTENNLQGSQQAYAVILAIFSIGIALGSVLAKWLSRQPVELGLVPFGALGMTLCGFWFYSAVLSVSGATVVDPSWGLLNTEILASLLAVGVFAGFYTVPLYTLLQDRTEEGSRGKIIGANNVLNALFMVAASLVAIAFLKWISVDIMDFFLLLFVVNIGVSLYIYKQVPEFFLRFITWLLLLFVYRIDTERRADIPEEGACVIASNHVSFVDALLITAKIRRPVRFVMYWKIFNTPVLSWLFRSMGAIPIAPRHENKEVFEQAFESIRQALENGEVIGIFPEGKITKDGQLNAFKSGIEAIVKQTPVPVYPIALKGIYGSMFSRKHKVRLPRKFMHHIQIFIDQPLPPEALDRQSLQQRVEVMLDEVNLRSAGSVAGKRLVDDVFDKERGR